MADNSQLNWIDYRDFSKGLWTQGSTFLMPQQAFQVMEDCYPRPEGGVRAWFKPSTTYLTTTGIDSTTDERFIAMAPMITSTGTAWLAVTAHITTGVLKGYFWDIGASTWTKQKTFTAHGDGFANGGYAQIIQYHDNTNGRNVWIVGITHAKSDATEDGWWLVRWDTNSWTRINATAFTGVNIAQYQSRIVGSALNTLWWTDPGTITTPASSNFLTIQSGHNDARDIISNIIPYSPTSLLVSTIGSGWWNIDGDITDPIVRQMSSDHLADTNQKVVSTENGAVFFEMERGSFITQNLAANFVALDEAMEPWNADQRQGFGYANGYLFAPGGRVHDMNAEAWWTASDAATSYSGFEQILQEVNGVNLRKGVVIPQFTSGGSLLSYALDERSSTRMGTYRVKTAPLQQGNGKQVVIREVEVMVKSFHASSTVEVTVAGDTRVSAAIPVGTNVIRFSFNKRDEYLDVQVKCKSNVSDTEAPVLEQFRVGVRADGHNVRLL